MKYKKDKELYSNGLEVFKSFKCVEKIIHPGTVDPPIPPLSGLPFEKRRQRESCITKKKHYIRDLKISGGIAIGGEGGQQRGRIGGTTVQGMVPT